MGMKTVIVVSLLVFAFTDAKVYDNFRPCKEHFYKDTPPVLDLHNDPDTDPDNFKSICQTMRDTGTKTYYATLYNQVARIPIYSAYEITSDDLKKGCKPNRPNSWRTEPGLENQATDQDYTNSRYNRGHINPVDHHCTKDSRKATMTLTNAVPQNENFNKGVWRVKESETLDYLRGDCTFNGARRYVVTGAVPSGKEYIPRPEDPGVDVPSYMWSAVRCEGNQGWSYGFYGENKNSPKIHHVPMQELNNKLTELYGFNVKIFADDGQYKKEKETIDTGSRKRRPNGEKTVQSRNKKTKERGNERNEDMENRIQNRGQHGK